MIDETPARTAASNGDRWYFSRAPSVGYSLDCPQEKCGSWPSVRTPPPGKCLTVVATESVPSFSPCMPRTMAST